VLQMLSKGEQGAVGVTMQRRETRLEKGFRLGNTLVQFVL